MRAPLIAVLASSVLLLVAVLGYVVERGVPSFGHRDRVTLAQEQVEQEPATPTKPVVYVAGQTLTLKPGYRVVAAAGAKGEAIRDLQVRLRQLAWYFGPITGVYDRQTTDGVRGFQEKRGLRATGVVNGFTRDRLADMTVKPGKPEMHNQLGSSASTSARLDARCTTGRAICVDKTSRTLRWVVDGEVLGTMAVRFGAAYTPTREGLFHVGVKSRYHVSSLYDSSMPFAMFFSGGQAVHYSSDFAARGYSGASHGCVNVRDRAGVEWLFDQVHQGDKVVVYYS